MNGSMSTTNTTQTDKSVRAITSLDLNDVQALIEVLRLPEVPSPTCMPIQPERQQCWLKAMIIRFRNWTTKTTTHFKQRYCGGGAMFWLPRASAHVCLLAGNVWGSRRTATTSLSFSLKQVERLVFDDVIKHVISDNVLFGHGPFVFTFRPKKRFNIIFMCYHKFFEFGREMFLHIL